MLTRTIVTLSRLLTLTSRSPANLVQIIACLRVTTPLNMIFPKPTVLLSTHPNPILKLRGTLLKLTAPLRTHPNPNSTHIITLPLLIITRPNPITSPNQVPPPMTPPTPRTPPPVRLPMAIPLPFPHPVSTTCPNTVLFLNRITPQSVSCVPILRITVNLLITCTVTT
uniref:Uncharacterized protein n=1 Tax=Cacopsylla melanoneura TaxID=428564 RepID=A0A8D8YGT1_9HEMI